MNRLIHYRWSVALLAVVVVVSALDPLAAQVRRGRAAGRTSVVRGEERTVVSNRRGTAVVGDEGYAAVGRRGGVVASNEERTVAANRRGMVVAGEEGYAAAGRYGGVVVGGHYEDHEGWRTAAAVAGGVAAGIAVGTMLSRPPAAATTVVVSGTSYWYDGGVYYSRAYSGGQVVYQVVTAPAGAVITTLPAGCTAVRRGNVVYRQCGATYYQPISGGYRVVVF